MEFKREIFIFLKVWFFLRILFWNFQRLKVDLIITDYCMPGMTGYELLKKIKVRFVTKYQFFVVLESCCVLSEQCGV